MLKYDAILNRLREDDSAPIIITLADDGEYLLPAGIIGFGQVIVGDNEQFASFRFSSVPVINIFNQTPNVVTTDTDTNFCIFDKAGQISLKNRLGAQKIIKLKVWY